MFALRVLFLYIAIITLQTGNFVSGTSVVPSSYRRRNENGCRLILPSNRIFAPTVTDETTRKELAPIRDNRNSGKWFVPVRRGEEIRVNCGRGNTLSIDDSHYYIRLSCVRGNEFRDIEDDGIQLPNGIACSHARKPAPLIRKNGTCSGKGTNFDVEFVAENPPRKFYSVCMDEVTSATLYSSSYIDGKSISDGLVESSGNRPDFRGQEFYPFPIKQAYKWDNAHEHLAELLGSPELVDKYFPTQQYRFSRGHLFPNADPIKRYEKQATFYYINTVPQWQNLNGGNWATIEHDVRKLASNLRKTLHVVTGAYGITTLPDGNNNDVQIYLARDSSGTLRLPVPRFLWKVVYEPVSSSAIAIVQVNNPWVLKESDTLCSDVCKDLNWLKTDYFSVSRKGYTYCCDVNELRETIPYLPRVEYKNLLRVDKVSNGNEDYDSGIESGSEENDEESDSYSDSSSGSFENYHQKYQKKPVTRKPASVENIETLFSRIKLGNVQGT